MPASSGRVQDEPSHQNESGCGGREDQVSKRREGARRLHGNPKANRGSRNLKSL